MFLNHFYSYFEERRLVCGADQYCIISTAGAVRSKKRKTAVITTVSTIIKYSNGGSSGTRTPDLPVMSRLL